MKIFRFILVLIVLLMLVVSAQAQSGTSGVSIICPEGQSFDNGVEVVVNMRPGFTYTATAIGINGFDPVLAVRDENGVGLCEDDTPEASLYSASLPSTGVIGASTTSARAPFSHNFNGLANISLVVGGFGNTSGEFLLVLEGMAVTAADGSGVGAGDPYSVNLTPNVVTSGVPVTTYMISLGTQLDPVVVVVDSNGTPLDDGDGGIIGCDDAGDLSSCWGLSENLSNSYITSRQGIQLGGSNLDAMVSLDFTGLDPNSLGFVNYLMTSVNQSTFGEYTVAFHMGTGEGVASSGTGTGLGDGLRPTVTEEPVQTTDTRPPSGVSGIGIICPNGQSFNNGVEVVVVGMRPGFSYTATAIGLNGFDPVLAVRDPNGVGLCEDDSTSAAGYTANLPSTGSVAATSTAAQAPFTHNFNDLTDISIVVGEFADQGGEFLLVLEGMAVTAADGLGDPFILNLTSNMIASGVPATVYMISKVEELDPLMGAVDSSGNVLFDLQGNPMACDDAGEPELCWGDSVSLAGASVTSTDGFQLGGAGLDAMIQIPIDERLRNILNNETILSFLMTRADNVSAGEYLVIFHVGTVAVGP